MWNIWNVIYRPILHNNRRACGNMWVWFFMEMNLNISLIMIVHVCLFLYMQNICILCFLITFTSFHIANVHEWVDYMFHMFSTYDKIRVSENTWRPQQETSPSSRSYTQVLYVLYFPGHSHMMCDFLCHHDVVKIFALLAICAGNRWTPTCKCQWRRTLMFSLICA